MCKSERLRQPRKNPVLANTAGPAAQVSWGRVAGLDLEDWGPSGTGCKAGGSPDLKSWNPRPGGNLRDHLEPTFL